MSNIITAKSVFDFPFQSSRLGTNFLRNLDQYLKNKNLELLEEPTFIQKYTSNGGSFQIPAFFIGFTECLGVAIISSIFSYTGTHFIYFYKNNINDFYVDFNVHTGCFNFNKSGYLNFNKSGYLNPPFQNTLMWKIIENEGVPKEYLSFMEDIRYFGLSNAERFIIEDSV